MKKGKKILLRFYFLLAILFCYGTTTLSIYSMQICTIESSSNSNNDLSSSLSENDSSDEDQINTPFAIIFNTEKSSQPPICNTFQALQNTTISIWQPPENN